jgi:hypothetical protein
VKLGTIRAFSVAASGRIPALPVSEQELPLRVEGGRSPSE